MITDISIWIHQVIQGYQDRRGNAVPNAHLIGLFNRICKLMYFKIKPVFVFDGGVPLLKKNTIVSFFFFVKVFDIINELGKENQVFFLIFYVCRLRVGS